MISQYVSVREESMAQVHVPLTYCKEVGLMLIIIRHLFGRYRSIYGRYACVLVFNVGFSVFHLNNNRQISDTAGCI